jgi:hypothetical protein
MFQVLFMYFPQERPLRLSGLSYSKILLAKQVRSEWPERESRPELLGDVDRANTRRVAE